MGSLWPRCLLDPSLATNIPALSTEFDSDNRTSEAAIPAPGSESNAPTKVLQPLRRGLGVVVQGSQEFGRVCGIRLIDGASEARILRILDQARNCIRREHPAGLARPAVVDDYHFHIGERLPSE